MFHPPTRSKFNFDSQQKWSVDERKTTNHKYLLFSFLLAKIVSCVLLSLTRSFHFIDAICNIFHRKHNFLTGMNLVDLQLQLWLYTTNKFVRIESTVGVVHKKARTAAIVWCKLNFSITADFSQWCRPQKPPQQGCRGLIKSNGHFFAKKDNTS